MQLHFDTAELNLLADVLLEETSRTSAEKFPGSDDLLDKVLAKDLRLDSGELEKVGELMEKCERALKDEIARAPDSTTDVRLRKKLAIMQRVRERVNEACVMF